MICLPVVVSPVKETLEMRGLAAIAWPTDPPGPVTTLSTPGGRISAVRPARIRRVKGVLDAGLMNVQLPAASAGAIFHAAISSGKFLEMVCDRIVVDRGDRAFLGADAAGEIPEMIDGKRNVRSSRLADRLAVVERLRKSPKLPNLLPAGGAPVEGG